MVAAGILAAGIAVGIVSGIGKNQVLCGDSPQSTSFPLKELYRELAREQDRTYLVYVLDRGRNSSLNPESISKTDWTPLYEPYRCGYRFLGWYLEADFRTKVTSVSGRDGDAVALYARWTRNVDSRLSVENYEYKTNQKLHPQTYYLKDCAYNFLDQIYIPGMPDTKENDFLNNYIFSKSQCPQGLEITDEFVLITSYSEGRECLGELMVFSRETGEYLVTLGMDPKSHLGGITFDGTNVWVCNSADKTIERISYDFIQLMAYENTKEVIDATDVVDIYPVSNIPSCITFFGGRLWIATHTLLFNSTLEAYHFNYQKNTLDHLRKYKIPAKVQGVSFSQEGKIYLSTSYGRGASSFLYCYSSLAEMSAKPNKPEYSIEMPPCSEELTTEDQFLYVIFESAGEKYFEGTDGKGKSVAPIDKILKIDLTSVK